MSYLQKRLVVVLGMHRSGTSVITRALDVFNVSLGEKLLPPVEGVNDKGFFEDIDINALNIEILGEIRSSWYHVGPVQPRQIEDLVNSGYFLRATELIRQKTGNASVFGFKDPRVAKLLPFWQKVFEYCRLDVSYLLTVRHPISVAKSLEIRDGFTHERSHLLWAGHLLTALVHTEGSARALVDYDNFLDKPESALRIIADRLKLQLNTQAFNRFQSNFLDRALQHTVYTADDLAADPNSLPLVKDMYGVLAKASQDNSLLDKLEFRNLIASWDQEFGRMRLSLQWIDHLSLQVEQLNSSVNLGQAEIANIIKRAIDYDKNFFKKSFDSIWYLRQYPDVATAGVDPYFHYITHGILENRFPSDNRAAFISAALAENFNCIQAKQASDVAHKPTADLAEMQKYVSDAIEKLHELYNLKDAERSRDSAQRDNIHILEMKAAQNGIGELLCQLSDREKSFSEKIEKMQRQGRAAIEHINRNYAEQAQHFNNEISRLREQGEVLLRQLTEYKKLAADEFCNLQRLNDEKESKHILEWDKLRSFHQLEMNNAKQRIEVLLVQIADREKETSIQIRDMQQLHENKEHALNRDLSEKIFALKAEIIGKENELHKLRVYCDETEQLHSNDLVALRSQLSAMQETVVWRWSEPIRKLMSALGEKSSKI